VPEGWEKGAKHEIKLSCNKFFVARVAGGLEGVVHADGLALEGLAAMGGAMVEGGIGHQST